MVNLVEIEWIFLWLQAKGPGHTSQRGGTWPIRHHTRLKQVQFDGFHGTRHQMDFFSYLLRSVAALEELYICSSYVTFAADFEETVHKSYAMDDEEWHLIYKLLARLAPSSRVKLIIST